MRAKITCTVLSLATLGVFIGLAEAQSKSENENLRFSSILDLVQNPGLLELIPTVDDSRDFSDADDDDTMEASGSVDFGDNIAGAYYQCPTCSPFGQSIKTIHADGTLVAASTADGETAGYGNWKKVGPKTIEVTAVVYGEGGTFVAQVSETMTFANGFGSYTGSLVTAVWFGGTVDLSNPQTPPDICTGDFGEFPISGSRLPVAYPACPIAP